MAEKYGEVPQKWTKKWWEYFWDYYKWHVIVTAFALLIAAVTMVQCATRPKYDMNIIYAGHMNYSEAEIERAKTVLSDYISDIDGNGEKSILFQPLVFLDNAGSAEYDYAVQTKLDVSFMDDCTFVYLFDEEQANIQMGRDGTDEQFVSTDVWAGDTSAEILIPPEEKGFDGKTYAVSLENSTLLKENNIYCEDLYIMIRQNYKDDEENIQAHKDSIAIAQALVK